MLGGKGTRTQFGEVGPCWLAWFEECEWGWGDSVGQGGRARHACVLSADSCILLFSNCSWFVHVAQKEGVLE